jgi:hypothetical protein
MSKCNPEAIKKAIQEVGGAKELALKIGVTYKSVLDWKRLIIYNGQVITG